MTIPQLRERINDLARRRQELEQALIGIDPKVGRAACFGSAATLYKQALDHGLIDRAEHDETMRQYGRRWRYVGD